MVTPLGAGYQPARAVAGHRRRAPESPRRSCPPRSTWWWSARGYCGLAGGRGAGPPRPLGGRARRARPRVGSQHAQRRHGPARAEGGPALARAGPWRAGPAPARARSRPPSTTSSALIADALDRLRLRAHRPALPVPRSSASSAHLDALAAELTSVGSTGPRRARGRRCAPSWARACSRPASWWSAAAGSTRPGSTPGLARARGRAPAPRSTRGHRRDRGRSRMRRDGTVTHAARRRRRRRRARGHERLRRLARAVAPPPGAPDGLLHHRHRAAGPGPRRGGAPHRAHVLQRPQPPLVLAPRRRGPDGLRGPEAARSGDAWRRRAITSTGR